MSIFAVTVECKISIDINVGTNASDITVVHSGFEANVVGDREIELFNIGKTNIRKAVKDHYGRAPSNVYLRSPTPWGDLYRTYNWEQVTRVLTIKSARVKGVTRKPMIVMSHDFENMSNVSIKVNTGISQTVENTIATSWSRSKEVTVSQEIDYEVNVLFAKASGTTGISFTSSWGETEERAESTTVGSSSEVETELLPGQAVTAVLTASRGALEVEVLYVETLRGNVAVNFKNALDGHHFRGPSIDAVMKSGGLKNEIVVKETIRLGFYTDASLKVFDKVTGVPV
ncbi:unnamed protein product, partial [Iphiclides podalirius]